MKSLTVYELIHWLSHCSPSEKVRVWDEATETYRDVRAYAKKFDDGESGMALEVIE